MGTLQPSKTSYHHFHNCPKQRWKTLLVFFPLCLQVSYGYEGNGIPGVQLSAASTHTALTGDFHIEIISSSFPPLFLQLFRLEGNLAQALTTLPVLPEGHALSLNVTKVTIPCGYFSKGGRYYLLLKRQPIGEENEDSSGGGGDQNVIRKSVDVRWPVPRLELAPEHMETYSDVPVVATLEFPEVTCSPVADRPGSAISEFWLELQYCGHSSLNCDVHDDATINKNNTAQILHSEQVRGLPGRRQFTLRCELFGLAGYYVLLLRPTVPSSTSLPYTAAYVKADWSKQFVFNVHARSIFPCDAHNGGITVLFQYPACILASGDRVRLFSRLRANVASLAPPTTLEYVTEQRFAKGQHSLHFDCDLFTERYVEYCFVYVSQSVRGAVADVRMDCVPTLPVSESESGGWGAWSPWTPCSSTCIGGTRSRYRFCDSPPPRYGATFCKGQAVETERCGHIGGSSGSGGIECFYGNDLSISEIVLSEAPEIQAEVGPFCRCGCVVHLGHVKPRRLLATSSQSCPGRTFWLIKADEDHIIEFKVEQLNLPCNTQWLKVRDGSALSSDLLTHLSGIPTQLPSVVNSTGPNILLEFYSDFMSDVEGQILCAGGFLAYSTQIRDRNYNNETTGVAVARSTTGGVPAAILKMTAVHIAAIFFLSILIISTILLGAQYMIKYRKYQVAMDDDQDSLADTNASSGSIAVRTRASSNATILSEVISLRRFHPHIMVKRKHTRLRESVTSQCDTKLEVTLAKEESMSVSSTATLTQDVEAEDQLLSKETSTTLDDNSEDMEGTLKRSSTLIEKEDSDEKFGGARNESVCNKKRRRSSNVSSVPPTFMHVRASSENGSKSDPGYYSPALSQTSTATIRTTNPKETKDKRNTREKLLAGPAGSDFSISGPDADLEMDYYDYNVVNAGAAPGSYLGMDPAFLVWIPPLDEDGEILPEDESHEMYELKPRTYIDPGSNRETPEDEEVLLLHPQKRRKSESSAAIKVISNSSAQSSPLLINRKNRMRVHPVNDDEEKYAKEESTAENVGKGEQCDDIMDKIRFADEEDDEEIHHHIEVQT